MGGIEGDSGGLFGVAIELAGGLGILLGQTAFIKKQPINVFVLAFLQAKDR